MSDSSQEFSDVFDLIERWQREQFPHATFEGAWKHLMDEIEELKQSPRDGQEMADIVFLLIQLAACAGTNLHDEIWKKLMVNMHRKWAEPDEHGVVYHVKD